MVAEAARVDPKAGAEGLKEVQEIPGRLAALDKDKDMIERRIFDLKEKIK